MIRSRFTQRCPTCGRGTLIPVEHLGELVCCSHCGGGFHAADASARPQEGTRELGSLIQRADRLLADRLLSETSREAVDAFS